MIVQTRTSALHQQIISKLNQYEKYQSLGTSLPSSPTIGPVSTHQQPHQYTHISIILKISQLQTFKTEPCRFITNPHQIVEEQNNLIHHCTEYPYYYQCEYYHSEKDQRRPPLNISHKQNTDIKQQTYLECEQRYTGLYFGDGYSEKVCWNWIQYLYHPREYKKKECNSISCRRKYCPKIHKGEIIDKKVDEKESEQQKKQQKIVQQIQKIRRIKKMDEKQYGQVMDEKKSTDAILNRQILQTKNKIYQYLHQIKKVQQEEIFKIGYVQNQIQTLAGTNNSLQDTLLIAPHIKNEEDYDRLFYQEQLKIIQGRQHEFKMFKNKDPHRIAALVLEYISAFLNSDGGSIYLGINDESIVHGLEVDQKWLDKFKLSIDSDGRNHLTPPLIPQKYSLRVIPVVHPKKLDLKVIQVKVFTQAQSEKKILTLFNKQCYLRMNASNHRLSASDIMEYMRLVNINNSNNSNCNNSNCQTNVSNNSNNSSSLNNPSCNVKKQLQNIQKIEQKLDELNQKQLKQLQQHINKINYKINVSLRKKQGHSKGKQKDGERTKSKGKYKEKKNNPNPSSSSSQGQF